MLCFPAATPSPCRTRTHVTGSPKTKVQRIPQSGQPGTGHSQKGQGQGSAQSYAVGHTWTAMRRARRARSPFPWAPWTPLLAGTVHCQQLPKESLRLRDRAHEGGKRVRPSLVGNDERLWNERGVERRETVPLSKTSEPQVLRAGIHEQTLKAESLPGKVGEDGQDPPGEARWGKEHLWVWRALQSGEGCQGGGPMAGTRACRPGAAGTG